MTFPWSLWESESSFLECFVLPLRSTHCCEMRSWRSSVEGTFRSTSHPSLVNTQLSASIFKLFKLASSDYTSNTTDCTCHLVLSYQFYLTGQSYCKDIHSPYQGVKKIQTTAARLSMRMFFWAHHSQRWPTACLCHSPGYSTTFPESFWDAKLI